MSSNSAEKEATSWHRSKLCVSGWHLFEVGLSFASSAFPSLLPSLTFVTAAGTFCIFAHYVTSSPFLSPPFTVAPPQFLPCAAQPPFLLPKRSQPSIPSKRRQQDTASRGLAGEGQGQLMWLCI